MRVQTKLARKDYPQDGIKKGDTYYKWTPYRQKPRCSKTMPSRSQLTSNDALAQTYDAFDTFAYTDASSVSSLAATVREAAEMEQEKFDNLPEGFQQGENGQAIEERANALNEAADALDELASTIEEEEGMDLPAKLADPDAVYEELENLEYHEIDHDTWTLKPLLDAINQAVSDTEPQV